MWTAGVLTGVTGLGREHDDGGGGITPVSDARFAAAVARGGFGFLLLDSAGAIVDANDPACGLLGVDAPDLTGRRLLELVHPDDRGWSESQLALLTTGGIREFRHEARLLDSSDREVWTELNARAVDEIGHVRTVVMVQDARDRRRRERELRRLADTDPLTELLNRRAFNAELDRHLAYCERYGRRGSLLLIDIDGLKQINDSRGHLAGDRAIIATARLLRGALRGSDAIARIGGDEFAVLLPYATAEQALAAAGALVGAVRAQAAGNGSEQPTLSIGIAAFDEHDDLAGVQEQADASLYDVKRAGGNGIGAHRGRLVELAGPLPDAGGGAGAQRRSDLVVDPGRSGRVELRTLLESLAEFGTASVDLIAWDLCVERALVTPAFEQAKAEALIERSTFDSSWDEWLYRLTPAGDERLRSLREAERISG